MATRVDMAAMMGNRAKAEATKHSTSTRYATAISNAEPGSYVTVCIDGSVETVELKTGAPVRIGDRVSVVNDAGVYRVIALESLSSECKAAAGTATKYIGFDDETGLVISGSGGTDPDGNNVRIDDDSVDIRRGGDVMASFGADFLSFLMGKVGIFVAGQTFFCGGDGLVLSPFMDAEAGCVAMYTDMSASYDGKARFHENRNQVWKYPPDGADTMRCEKNFTVCVLTFAAAYTDSMGTLSTTGMWECPTKLHVGMRPSSTVKSTLICSDSTVLMAYVMADGTVRVYTRGSVPEIAHWNAVSGQAVWFASS